MGSLARYFLVGKHGFLLAWTCFRSFAPFTRHDLSTCECSDFQGLQRRFRGFGRSWQINNRSCFRSPGTPGDFR